MQTIKTSLLGFGDQGKVRDLAYNLETYYRNFPVRTELLEAFVLPEEAEAARACGWTPTTDLDATIANPAADLIEIRLPTQMRFAAATAALKAGKHVYVEPLLSDKLDESRAAAELADSRPKQLATVDFMYRRVPANAYARRIATEKRFGRLLEARFQFSQNWGFPQDAPWRGAKSRGVVFELGAAAFDLLYFTTGVRPEKLYAQNATFFDFPWDALNDEKAQNAETAPKSQSLFGGEDATKIVFTAPENVVGSIVCSRSNRGAENAFSYELHFENGSVRWTYADFNYISVYTMKNEPNMRGWQRILCNRGGFPYDNFSGGHMYGSRDVAVNGVSENLRFIAGQNTIAPLATFRDAYEAHRAVDAAKKSFELDRPVKLEEIR